jgi:hypothetical protein
VKKNKIIARPFKIRIPKEVDWKLKEIAAREKVGIAELRGQILIRFVDQYTLRLRWNS